MPAKTNSFLLSFLLALPLLAGCTKAKNPPLESLAMEDRPSAVTGACNAEPVGFALGQEASVELQEEARQYAGARLVRVLQPGQAVSQEFDSERLNLTVNGQGIVEKVYCS